MYDGTNIPFQDEVFDVAVSMDALEHVPLVEIPALVGEMVRVSKLVITSMPVADGLTEEEFFAQDPCHTTYLSSEGWTDLLSSAGPTKAYPHPDLPMVCTFVTTCS
jgi:hypothetical protein